MGSCMFSSKELLEYANRKKKDEDMDKIYNHISLDTTRAKGYDNPKLDKQSPTSPDNVMKDLEGDTSVLGRLFRKKKD